MPGASAPGLATRAAVVLLLFAGGVVLLFVAAWLAAAALHWTWSPVGFLPLPGDHGVRGFWLIVVALVLIALVWLVARHGEPRSWFATPDGDISVSEAQLNEVAARAAQAHAEVVRAVAQVTVARGGLSAEVHVYGRPLADRARLGDQTEARVRAALLEATGMQVVRVRVRSRVLAVRQLARYLP
jgi:hypothetical protein